MSDDQIALKRPVTDLSWIVFDTETSGAYPIGSEVVEIGAIKFSKGIEVDQLQLLIRPERPVPPEIVAIHNISNERLATERPASEVAQQVWDFFDADIYVAHHAPFDIGFMAPFFEKQGLLLPKGLGLCTSLLGRKLIHNVPNHRLQTLVQQFGIEGGQAHRALDDARACAEVFKIILDKMDSGVTVEKAQKTQGYPLPWHRFSLFGSQKNTLNLIIQATQEGRDLEIIYNKGTHKGRPRKVKPLGIVRSPLDGDYMPGWCYIDQKRKRFMVQEIADIGLA